MSHRALGAQFKTYATNKAEAVYMKAVGPLHRAILAQGEANQPGIDQAMAMHQQSIERTLAKYSST